MNVTLRHLRAFVAVAQAESFTAAASLIYLTQSTLTKTIRELECEVGVPLFERTTRRVVLTPHGAAFLPNAQKLLTDLDRSLADLVEHSSGSQGTVYIACGTAFASTVLPIVMRRLHKHHPGIRVRILNETSGGVVRRITSGEVDIGIGSPVGDDTDALVARRLLSARLGVLFPPNYPYYSSVVREDDLASLPLLRDELDTSIMSVLNQHMPRLWLGASSQFVVTDLDTQFQMVRAGIGPCVLSALAASHASAASLRYLLIESSRLQREVYAFTRKNTPLSPVAETFLEVVRQTLPSIAFRDGVTLEPEVVSSEVKI